MAEPFWWVHTSTTELQVRFGPGGSLRCWCGWRIEDLGPYSYAMVRVQQSSTGLPNGVHRAIKCPRCGTVIETTYSLRPDSAA